MPSIDALAKRGHGQNRAMARMTLRPALALGKGLMLLGLTALAGCSGSASLPLELYVAIGTNPDQTISGDLRDGIREQLLPIRQGFRRLHPDTFFQVSLYPETDLPQTLRHRNGSGLAPDLMYVNGDTALRMLQAGLVTPFPISAAQRRLFNPEDLRRLTLPDGRLAGLPVVVHTQLSCFNRRRMASPPRTVQELLAASAAGKPIGLNADMAYLLWSVGSLGALPAFEHIVSGQAATAADRQALAGWLSWLQEASLQQRVSIYPDQQTAEAELAAGRVDWIPCRSSALPSLRRRMGSSLAVAPLPDGEGHRASPFNRLRVLALGRNSTARGRERSLAFGRYSVNPLTQRSMTLNSQITLPANRFVGVPVQSSQTLATLVEAADQGRQANALVSMVHNNDPRLPLLQNLLTALVFGEIRVPETTTRLIQILQGA